MGEVCGFIEFVHPQTFHPVQPPATYYERPKGAGLVSTDNDKMEFAAVGKCIATGLYPGILVHRTVGMLGKQPPALGLVVDCAEFLNNPD